ncbi:MAG: hypothetical protein IKS37_05405 [Solobacterium sp.]|nr:hypothetical protein [Solobacterium sp.]
MIKNKYVAYTIYIIAFVVLWNLINFIFNRDAYQFFSLSNNVVPLGVAAASGYLFCLRNGDDE